MAAYDKPIVAPHTLALSGIRGGFKLAGAATGLATDLAFSAVDAGVRLPSAVLQKGRSVFQESVNRAIQAAIPVVLNEQNLDSFAAQVEGSPALNRILAKQISMPELRAAVAQSLTDQGITDASGQLAARIVENPAFLECVSNNLAKSPLPEAITDVATQVTADVIRAPQVQDSVRETLRDPRTTDALAKGATSAAKQKLSGLLHPFRKDK